MRIKSFLFILACIGTGLLAYTQKPVQKEKGKKYPSVFKEGITVNGNSLDWENSLFNFDKSAQANFAIVNDTGAFYICLRIANDAAQFKVLRNGIDLRFNSKGKKKPEATLHFPMGGRMNFGEQRDRRTMRLMALLQMQDMEMSGFRDGFNGIQNIKSGKNGFMACLNWDSINVMIYEVRIPFRAFNTDINTANPLAVGIIIKGAPKPKEPRQDMQDGGQGDMRGGQGQGRHGGMNHGDMGREGQMSEYGGNMQLFEDDEIWRYIVVAKKE